MKAKICGITTVEETCKLSSLRPDAIGIMVGFDSSVVANNVPLERGKEIVKTLDAIPYHIDTFMLTAAKDAATNIDYAKQVNPSHIQLTGDIPPEEISKIKKELPQLSIVKVIHVQGPEAIQDAKKYENTGVLSAILLDSGAINKVGGKKDGGTNKINDWSISKEIVKNTKLPVWLAGGLQTANLKEAIDTVHPYGVDVDVNADTSPDVHSNVGVQSQNTESSQDVIHSTNFKIVKDFIDMAQSAI